MSNVSFTTARRVVRKAGIQTRQQYREQISGAGGFFETVTRQGIESSQFRKLPYNPEQVYAVNGWTNWSDFLGRKTPTARRTTSQPRRTSLVAA